MKFLLHFIAIIFYSTFPSVCISDELIATGTSKTDFTDFLSRSTVKERASAINIEFQDYVYKLYRGKIIDNGCQHTGMKTKDLKKSLPEIAIEIAHDVSTCERLFIIGVPKEIPEWLKSPQ